MPQPTATPTPEPELWDRTGHWRRDAARERAESARSRSLGFAGHVQVATLDSVPGERPAQLSLSLACVDDLRIGYLSPYSGVVPYWADAYVIGMWNERRNDWRGGDPEKYRDPLVTGDGSEIYTPSQAQLNRILRALEKAALNESPDLVLRAGILDSGSEEREGLWAEFEVTGLQDALRYLPCL